MKRAIFLGLGSLFALFGAVGIFLPLLPTTPFLLLAAFFYARSSARFYDWLVNNRWLGPYIRAYRSGEGLPLSRKLSAMLLLWTAIGISTHFAVDSIYLDLALLCLAAGVSIHLLRMKTARPKTRAALTQPAETSPE